MNLCAVLGVVIVLGVAPLDDGQKAQLDSADDRLGEWDTAALYPLLTNALTWTDIDPASRLPGATIPDYAAIAADPAAHRGQVFIIEGLFAQATQQELRRPGLWGDTITRWVVQVDPVADEVVVVYLTHPPSAPRVGATVRVPARFYKLWPSRTLAEQPIVYATFVGHSAAVVDGGGSASGTSGGGAGGGMSQGSRLGVIVVVLAMAGAMVFVLRRVTRMSLTPRPLRSQLQRREEQAARGMHRQREVAEQPDDAGPPLPEDPADALAELERRHDTPAT